IGLRVRDRIGDGRGERRAVRPARRRRSRDGVRLDPVRLHRRRGRRHGEPRRFGARGDLHQPPRSLFLAVGQPGASWHHLFRRADPDLAVPADRPVCRHAEMRDRQPLVFWTGFAIIVALLIASPLVLPPFWARFVTEILIWGLLAMSSDILIGYTGMVSFGHSAFFGLGMYGAAAALLITSQAAMMTVLPKLLQDLLLLIGERPNLLLALAF